MDFKATIVTAPNDNLAIKNDIQLVKLGLLYADKITLASPNIYLTLMYIKMATSAGKERLDYAKAILPNLSKIQKMGVDNLFHMFSLYEKAKNKIKRDYNDIKLIVELDEALDETFRNIKISDEVYYMDDIAPSIANGRIIIKDLSKDFSQIPEFLLHNAIEGLNDELSYPLFDDEIEGLISAYSKETNTSFDYHNSKEIITAKDLFLRLPNVDTLTIEQITSLRSEMELEWTRYKNLVSEYSSEIDALPFDPSIDIKLSKKYNKDFKPQLLELQSMIDKNSYVKHLYSQVLENALDVYSLLCVGAATMLEIKKAMVGITGVAVAKGLKAVNEQRKQKEKIKENKLYFYHKLSQLR